MQKPFKRTNNPISTFSSQYITSRTLLIEPADVASVNMDYLLKCYLEEYLTGMPRNTLHDRRNRRSMVEYISTLIQGCSQGQNCDSQKTARDAIVALMRHHEESRNSNGTVCMMGKFHNVLYVAIKLCFDWQLKDTGTVVALLEHIYSCEKTFERIFVGAIFGTRAPHYIAGWKSDFDNQEENLRAIVYYIDHATNGNLEMVFENRLVRFIDVPIESCGKASALKICIQLGLPDKVHILLRYGAAIEDGNLVEHLMKRLLEFRHCYPYNLVACLQIVLRVVPKASGSKEKILEEFSDLVDDGVLPPARCGLVPIELKHLCRCAIRKRLWDNHQLPNGIWNLLIPDSLRRYLDILHD